MANFITVLSDIFLVGLFALVTTSEPSYILEDPIVILVVLCFVVGNAIGTSGIGGAALVVPLLLFLGLPPQAMVRASLLFSFFTNILGIILHTKKDNYFYYILQKSYRSRIVQKNLEIKLALTVNFRQTFLMYASMHI